MEVCFFFKLLLWVELCPQTRCVEVLTSVPQTITVLGDRVLKEVIKSNEVIRVGPNPIRLVSLEEEKIRTRDARRRGRVRHGEKTAGQDSITS